MNGMRPRSTSVAREPMVGRGLVGFWHVASEGDAALDLFDEGAVLNVRRLPGEVCPVPEFATLDWDSQEVEEEQEDAARGRDDDAEEHVGVLTVELNQ